MFASYSFLSLVCLYGSSCPNFSCQASSFYFRCVLVLGQSTPLSSPYLFLCLFGVFLCLCSGRAESGVLPCCLSLTFAACTCFFSCLGALPHFAFDYPEVLYLIVHVLCAWLLHPIACLLPTFLPHNVRRGGLSSDEEMASRTPFPCTPSCDSVGSMVLFNLTLLLCLGIRTTKLISKKRSHNEILWCGWGGQS